MQVQGKSLIVSCITILGNRRRLTLQNFLFEAHDHFNVGGRGWNGTALTQNIRRHCSQCGLTSSHPSQKAHPPHHPSHHDNSTALHPVMIDAH